MADEQNSCAVSEEKPSDKWSIEPYLDQLKDFSPPQGAFDPEGSWEHTYYVYPIYAKWSKWTEQHRGKCRIKRKTLSDNGVFRLKVSSEVTFIDYGHGMHPAKTQLTTARVRCANNALATLQSWKLKSAALDADKKPRPLSKMSESGTHVNGTINLTSPKGISRQLKVCPNLTSNWSLFDAVQRLHKKEPPDTEFTMLEDLRLPRANQRLTSDKPIDVVLGGRITRLYGFHQIGEGILPIYYWLDEQGRLLFALGGVRIYVWHTK